MKLETMKANNNTDDNIDWQQTTWEGSRKAQLKQWLTLSIRERLQALENKGEVARHFQQMREKGKLKSNK